jgi:hypothetical protein
VRNRHHADRRVAAERYTLICDGPVKPHPNDGDGGLRVLHRACQTDVALGLEAADGVGSHFWLPAGGEDKRRPRQSRRCVLSAAAHMLLSDGADCSPLRLYVGSAYTLLFLVDNVLR